MPPSHPKPLPPSRPARRRFGLAWMGVVTWAAMPVVAGAAQAAGAMDWSPLDAIWRPDKLTLLGEVHDNAAQHAARRDWLARRLIEGWRPAMLMEQLDRKHQRLLDRTRQYSGLTAAAWLASLPPETRQGWHWPHYLPMLELALRFDLPLLAANVCRQEARAIMRDGLAAHGFDPAIPPDIQSALAHDIDVGHCGALPPHVADRMVLAQVARDQHMARLLAAHATTQGAVLLAGNGHVRRDVGVPRWLPEALQRRTISVGLLEPGDTQAERHDVVVRSPGQERADPCAAFRPAAGQPTSASAPAASSTR